MKYEPRQPLSAQVSLPRLIGPFLALGLAAAFLPAILQAALPPHTPLWATCGADATLLMLLGLPIFRQFLLEPLRAAARRSEKRLAAFRASALDSLITIDTEERVLEWNPAAERTFGWSATEAIGRPLTGLIIPPALRAAHGRGLAHFLATREGPVLDKRIEVPALCKDGREIVVELTATAVRLEGRTLFSACLRDITERKRAEEALRLSEERYRTLTEHSPMAVAVHRDQRVVYVNAAAVRLFGATEGSQMLGRSIFDFIHPDGHAQARERAQRSQEDGRPSPLTEQRYLRLDGTAVEVEVVSTPIIWEGAAAGQVLVRDITARKEAESRYHALFENMVEGVFQSAPDGRALLANPAMARLLGYETPEEMLATITDLRSQLYVKPEDRDEFQARMRADDRLIGFETQFHRKDRSVADVSLNVRTVRDGAGRVACFEGTVEDITERKRAEAEIQRLNRQTEQRLDRIVLLNYELERAYDSTIEGWSRALDLRDHETEGHSRRVTGMTVRLAEALGLTADEVTQARRGALLHDIGKMGVPDDILLKPGPLTEEEWALMRRHPDLAREMLWPVEFLRPALDIPYCHHEKWDGTGYPRGLRGEDIPLSARLFAIVDVWDALRSDRPYRRAWPLERVCGHVASLAGTHFDPALVPLFLKAVAGLEDGGPGCRGNGLRRAA